MNDIFTETRDAYILRRIRALRDIPSRGVKAGDLGGWVASENNLAQEGECWIGGNARAYMDAVVADNALVEDSSEIWGDASVSSYACIGREAHIASTRDYLVISPIGLLADSVTFYKASFQGIWASHCGHQAPADKLPHLWGHNDTFKRDYLAALEYAKRTLLY